MSESEQGICRECGTALAMGLCPHDCDAVATAFAAKSIEEYKSYACGVLRELFAPEVR